MTLEELQLPSVDSLPSLRDIHAEHERWLEQMARDQRPPEAVKAPDFDYLAYVAERQAEVPRPAEMPVEPPAHPRYRFHEPVSDLGIKPKPASGRAPAGHPDYVPLEFPKAVHRGTDSQVAKDRDEEMQWNAQGYR